MHNSQESANSKKHRNNSLKISKKLQLYLYKVEAEYRRRNRAAEMLKLFRFLTH